MRHIILILILSFLLPAAANAAGDIVVAPDGSGDYTSIGEALRKVRGDSEEPVRIFVKNGVYNLSLIHISEPTRH